MNSPTTVKEVQRLIGYIATLGRFMSRSADTCHSFFKVLKKKACFGWDDEAEQTFQNLKEYLGRLPQTVSPVTWEPSLTHGL